MINCDSQLPIRVDYLFVKLSIGLNRVPEGYHSRFNWNRQQALDRNQVPELNKSQSIEPMVAHAGPLRPLDGSVRVPEPNS